MTTHQLPGQCAALRPTPHHPGALWTCHCGQWWASVTANDVFTGGPAYIWARVHWWNLLTRLRIHLHVKGRT